MLVEDIFDSGHASDKDELKFLADKLKIVEERKADLIDIWSDRYQKAAINGDIELARSTEQSPEITPNGYIQVPESKVCIKKDSPYLQELLKTHARHGKVLIQMKSIQKKMQHLRILITHAS